MKTHKTIIRNPQRTMLLVFILLSGCGRSTTPTTANTAATEDAMVLLNVTSNPEEEPQSVDMAMKLAGFSLDEGRKVVMFFNVKGVHTPTKTFDEQFAFQDNTPIKSQLQDLIERGAEVHVCPICLKALKVEASDILEGAQVTTRAKLFANIRSNTAVFTY